MGKINFLDAEGSAYWAFNFLCRFPLDKVQNIEVEFKKKDDSRVKVTVTFQDGTSAVADNGFRAGFFCESSVYLFDFLRKCKVHAICAASVYHDKNNMSFHPNEEQLQKLL